MDSLSLAGDCFRTQNGGINLKSLTFARYSFSPQNLHHRPAWVGVVHVALNDPVSQTALSIEEAEAIALF